MQLPEASQLMHELGCCLVVVSVRRVGHDAA